MSFSTFALTQLRLVPFGSFSLNFPAENHFAGSALLCRLFRLNMSTTLPAPIAHSPPAIVFRFPSAQGSIQNPHLRFFHCVDIIAHQPFSLFFGRGAPSKKLPPNGVSCSPNRLRGFFLIFLGVRPYSLREPPRNYGKVTSPLWLFSPATVKGQSQVDPSGREDPLLHVHVFSGRSVQWSASTVFFYHPFYGVPFFYPEQTQLWPRCSSSFAPA